MTLPRKETMNEQATLPFSSHMDGPQVGTANFQHRRGSKLDAPRHQPGPVQLLLRQEQAKRERGRPRLTHSDRAARESSRYSPKKALIGICDCAHAISLHEENKSRVCAMLYCPCSGYVPARSL